MNFDRSGTSIEGRYKDVATTSVRSRPAALTLTPAAEVRIAELMSRAPEGAIGVKLSTPRRGCSGLAYSVDYVTEEKPFDEKIETPGGDLYEAVIEALKEIYDPEIPVNIYDLGLIYEVEITPEHHALIKMTLTTPHCPVAESMPGEIELRVGAVPGVGHAEVELVWDPPWDPQKMSDEAKLELGML